MIQPLLWVFRLRTAWRQWGDRRRARGNEHSQRWLTFEVLESRLLLSSDVVFNGGTISLTPTAAGGAYSVVNDVNGNITINGQVVHRDSDGAGSTIVNVSQIVLIGSSAPDSLFIDLPSAIGVEADGGSGPDSFETRGNRDWTINDTAVGSYSVTGFEHITVTGGSGDNTIDASGFSAYVHLIGGQGKDTLKGGALNAYLEGGEGDDTLVGGDGNDTLVGGAGIDDLDGGGGQDDLRGDGEADTLDGGAGHDTLSGGDGNDKLYGGTGNDTLRGNDDNDELYGEENSDSLYGGAGNDTLNGGDGNDQLFGEDDVDTLNGDGDNDSLYGGQGDDTVNGGPGDDLIVEGDDGDDTLNPGTGNLFDALSFHSELNDFFRIGPGFADSDEDDGLTGIGASERNTIVVPFDQYFVTGNTLDNVLRIVGDLASVTFDPGLGEDDLVLELDAPLIRPIGTRNRYTISSFTADLVPIGQVKWSGSGVDVLKFQLGGGDSEVVLDQWNDVLDELNGGGGDDTLSITRDANMTVAGTLAAGLVSFQSPITLANIPFTNFEQVALTGGAGNNTLDASAFMGRVTLDGGINGNDTLLGTPNDDVLRDNLGNDTLRGNGGNDKLTGGNGSDILDGGADTDQIIETLPATAAAGGRFVLTNSRLTGRGTDTLTGVEGADLRGLGGNDTFDIGAWTGRGMNKLTGAGGTDTLAVVRVNADFSLYQHLTETRFKRTSAGGNVEWLVGNTTGLAPIEVASIMGGADNNRFEVLDTRQPGFFSGGILLNGGGYKAATGTDRFVYSMANETDTVAVIALSNSQLTHNENPRPIKLVNLPFADVTTSGQRVNVSQWTKTAKITGNSAATELFSDATKATSFAIDASHMRRKDGALFEYHDVKNIRLDGGDAANVFTISVNGRLPTLALEAKGGKDSLFYNIQSADVTMTTISPMLASMELVAAGLADPISRLENRTNDIEVVRVTGSPGDDKVQFDGLDPTDRRVQFTLDGAGGRDTIGFTTYDPMNVLLANSRLVVQDPLRLDNVVTVNLASMSFEQALLEDQNFSPGVWDLSGWTQAASLAGGSDDILISSADANATLTDTLLTRSNGAAITLSNRLKEIRISGGKSANLLDASAYSYGVTMYGGDGKDTLTGGSGNDRLHGDLGDDTLYGGGGEDDLDGGAGNDWLDGGAGVDNLLEGGSGIDHWKNGQVVIGCELPWV